MLAKIFDLPVIVQGALGSFLFWLTYEVTKRLLAFLSAFIGRYNRHWKRETLMFEQVQAKFMVSDGEQRTQYLILCIYGGLSRAIQGLIYVCFGLISGDLLGPISLFAYAFAIIYFFRALRAVFLEVSSGKDLEYYKQRIIEIDSELAKLNAA